MEFSSTEAVFVIRASTQTGPAGPSEAVGPATRSGSIKVRGENRREVSARHV